jgi:hypothetical protein
VAGLLLANMLVAWLEEEVLSTGEEASNESQDCSITAVLHEFFDLAATS